MLRHPDLELEIPPKTAQNAAEQSCTFKSSRYGGSSESNLRLLQRSICLHIRLLNLKLGERTSTIGNLTITQPLRSREERDFNFEILLDTSFTIEFVKVNR
ncbi:hypothetical protein V6Z12_D10G284000 [Gossypium hirsutum]